MPRHPPHFLVGGFQGVAEARHADEPGGHGTINERRVGAIAVGVAVNDGVAVVQGAVFVQVADDVAIRILHELTGEVAHFVREGAA